MKIINILIILISLSLVIIGIYEYYTKFNSPLTISTILIILIYIDIILFIIKILLLIKKNINKK